MMIKMQNLSAKMTLILETVCLMCQAEKVKVGRLCVVFHLHA